MTISYSQVAQIRENSTNAVSLYSPDINIKQAQLYIKITNVTSLSARVRVFHDENGSTYDESTALFWDTVLFPGRTLEVTNILIKNQSGNVAYRSDAANALTATVYAIEEYF